MPSLQVRDLPADVHEALVRTARAQGRSVAQQSVVALRSALGLDVDATARRRALFDRLGSQHPVDWSQLTDPSDLIREDRDR